MDYKYTILIVEDESSIQSFMTTILKANNYNVLLAKNGTEAIMYISSHCPDIIILDLGLPDMDGQKVIQYVRTWSQIPIIVVSARTGERDKVSSLDLGADDFITKPFSTSELLARIRTAIRHLKNENVNEQFRQNGKFVIRQLVIDYDKRHVYLNGEDVHFTQTEYKLIELLSKYAGRVLTYEHIIKSIWGPNAGDDNQILRVNMANIRRKIEVNPAEPEYIFTEIGVGYRMLESDN